MRRRTQALKKAFKKLDHDVNIQDFLGSSTQTIEELSNHSQLLQAQICEVEKRFGYWTDPEKIDNIDHIRAMEESLRESLSRIQMHKENFGKQQLMSLECAVQFQNGLHLPLELTGEQQSSHLRGFMMTVVSTRCFQKIIVCCSKEILSAPRIHPSKAFQVASA